MAGEAPFWQIDAQQPQQPLTLSLLQERQPPSNFAQAQGTYNKMWMDGRTDADRKIEARRDALKVDGMPPVISDVELLAHSNRAETLYMAIDGKVFDITQFMAKHPGGVLMMTRNAGLDVTAAFNRVGHSKRAREMLADLYVADLVLTGQVDITSMRPPSVTSSSDSVAATRRSLEPPP